MKVTRIKHAGHCQFTGKPLHDIEQIEVPFEERHDHAPFEYLCGVMKDGSHLALCERTVAPTEGPCSRCQG